MSRLKRTVFFLISFFFLICTLFVLAFPVNAKVSYTPRKTVTISNNDIEPRVYFDGANYKFITPFGNYTFLQPLNILRFTDFQGKEVIDKSVFILQYKSGSTWLPLLDFKRMRVIEASNYHYELKYDVNYKDRGKNYNVSFVKLTFTIPSDPENRKPKISIEQNKTIYWDKFFKDSRWIWDVVPNNHFKYWKNSSSIVDITQIQDSISIGKNTRVKFTDNSASFKHSVLDVGDFGIIDFEAGDESFWNSKGFVGIFPINETKIDPITYTEEIKSFSIGADNAWTDYDLFTLQVVPKGAIAEIVCVNKNVGTFRSAGVRTDGSVITRNLGIHEAEGGGVTTMTMLVKCDSSTGLIECFAQVATDVDFYLLGYFEGCDFTEARDFLGFAPNIWTDLDLSGFSVPANAVVQILMENSRFADIHFAGVRENGSVLERGVVLDEAEGLGGGNYLSLIVKANGISIIEWKSDTADRIEMWLLGWFSSKVDFTEGFTEYNPANDNTWTSKTITEADASSIVVFALTHEDAGAETLLGLRAESSLLSRMIDEHEAEGGAFNGFEICVLIDADKKCEVYCEDASEAGFHYMGFFIDIPIPPPSIPTLLFGAGFNSSIPYVELYWDHNLLNVQFFEVQNSSDYISWDYLGQNITAQYKDFQVLNGTERYYRVRACNFTEGNWYNSSFTEINFETVYFIPRVQNILINVTGAWTEYNFTWIRTLTGLNASVGGNWLNQTYWLDDYQFNVTEVVGAPGYDIRFDVSGLPDNLICLQIVGFMEYDGSAGHTFEVQAWNYTSSAWITVSDIPDTSARWINGSLDCTSGDFIQSGVFHGRYYHPSPGNVNHDFVLDYGKLRAFAPFPVPAPSGADRFFIGLFIGIALLIIAYLYNEHGR